MIARKLGLALALAVATASAARAATGSAPVAAGPGTTRAAVTAAVAAAIEGSYVFPQKRTAIAAALRQALASGRYDSDEPHRLAALITDDLRAASGDHHLYLEYDPAQYAAARRSEHKAAPAAGEDADALHRRRSARDHYGLTELRVLPGNLRYLQISGFPWVRDETGLVYDDAMRFLRGGDAVILDLRGNPGGSHSAVRYLVSHFLDDDVLEMTFLSGDGGSEESRTVDQLPAGRLKGRPLYVLIDGNTGSAAEAFAYDVQQFKLGELVGARTVGAANNNELVPIAPSFMLSVSTGRPVHAVSHGNWEGVGVQPSVAAPPAQALDVAMALALKKLAKQPGVDRERAMEYDWARVEVEARLHPPTLSPAQLAPLTGRYGDIELAVVDGALTLSRPNRPRWPQAARLQPLTGDGLFAISGFPVARVRVDGQTLSLLWSDDPQPQRFPRH